MSPSLQEGLRGDFGTISKHSDKTDLPSCALHVSTHACIYISLWFFLKARNRSPNSLFHLGCGQPSHLTTLTKDNQRQFMPELHQSVHKEGCYDPTKVAHGWADEDSQVPGRRNAGMHTHHVTNSAWGCLPQLCTPAPQQVGGPGASGRKRQRTTWGLERARLLLCWT